MELLATLLIALTGMGCVCTGYKLFCGLPALNTGRRPNRAVVLINIVPGALLALLGAGILAAEARSVLASQPAVHHHQPGEGTSWHQPNARVSVHTV